MALRHATSDALAALVPLLQPLRDPEDPVLATLYLGVLLVAALVVFLLILRRLFDRGL